jgi:HlyD family secretion protein
MNKWIPILCMSLLSACSEQVVQVESAEGDTLTATGEIISLKTATITPPSVEFMWNYKIQFLAPENTPVKKGDVVVKFDALELRNRLIEKQSELDAAIKQAEQNELKMAQNEQELTLALAEAEMNFDKEKRKVEIVDVAITEVKKQKQKKTFELASLRLEQAKQKLAQFYESKEINQSVEQAKVQRLTTQANKIKTDINKLTVKSPKDGIVMYVTDHNGEKPAVGETIWQGRSVLTIPSLDALAIKAEYDEPDTQKVSVNQPVKITLEPYPELPLQGKIVSLGQNYKKKSTNNPKVVFEAMVELEQIDQGIMRPGMQAKLVLQQGEQL